MLQQPAGATDLAMRSSGRPTTATWALADLHPRMVLALGQAGGRCDLSLERVAINVDDARMADNAGNQPIDEAVVAGGPAAYFSSLPIKAMVAGLRAAGFPASVSQTAGTFVCNHVFYGLQHRLAASGVRLALELAMTHARDLRLSGGDIS